MFLKKRFSSKVTQEEYACKYSRLIMPLRNNLIFLYCIGILFTYLSHLIRLSFTLKNPHLRTLRLIRLIIQCVWWLLRPQYATFSIEYIFGSDQRAPVRWFYYREFVIFIYRPKDSISFHNGIILVLRLD